MSTTPTVGEQAQAQARKMAQERYVAAFITLLPRELAEQVAALAVEVDAPSPVMPRFAMEERALTRLKEFRHRYHVSRARLTALVQSADGPLVAPCPEHPKVLTAGCAHCSAFGMDQEWRELIRAVASSGSGKGAEEIPDHEIILTFEPRTGWEAKVECYAYPDADCHLACTVPDCQAVGEIERTDEGVLHTVQDPTGESTEVTHHPMRVEEECHVVLFLSDAADGVDAEGEDQPWFEVGRFPIRTEWQDGGLSWVRA